MCDSAARGWVNGGDGEAEHETLAGYTLLMKQATPPVRWVTAARGDLATL